MGIAQRKVHRLALELGAISHTDDVEILLEPLRHALHCVGHQSPRQAMQRRLLIALADGMQLAALLLKMDSSRQIHTQLALRSLDFDRVRGNLNLHSRGHDNRFSSYARHSSISLDGFLAADSHSTCPSVPGLRQSPGQSEPSLPRARQSVFFLCAT